MAMGNIGNLLQHFVGLTVANQLVSDWNQPENPIEYIDCFSMAPWESFEPAPSSGFKLQVGRFPAMAPGDRVASAFQSAWTEEYQPASIPNDITVRKYPNTAVLLRSAFPQQRWNMRLHDICGDKQLKLQHWMGERSGLGNFPVNGAWKTSTSIVKCPIPIDRPTFLMLDPRKVVSDDSCYNGEDGYLSSSDLRFVLGDGALTISSSDRRRRNTPCAVVVLSYSDKYRRTPDRIVRSFVQADHWKVEQVEVPVQVRGQKYHQSWVALSGIDEVVSGGLQAAWNDWLNGV